MKKIAFLFPGQGSQQVEMGATFLTDEKSKSYYNIADRELGFELSDIMLNGPIEDLTLTYHAQPALLTTSVMIAQKLIDKGIKPHYVAGHSLGEFSALVTAGALSFEEAVRLVNKRGIYMNEAVPAGEGAMAAILGVQSEQLQEVLDGVDGVVEIANINSSNQIVISGAKESVKAARKVLKEMKLGKAIPLPVSGPFHSSLMKPAELNLMKDLQSSIISNATDIQVIANVTAQPIQTKNEILKELVEQVCSPVQWEKSVKTMIGLGVEVFIECGPGTVLSSLVNKIDSTVECYSVQTKDDLNQLLEIIK